MSLPVERGLVTVSQHLEHHCGSCGEVCPTATPPYTQDTHPLAFEGDRIRFANLLLHLP